MKKPTQHLEPAAPSRRIEESLARPTPEELLKRLRSQGKVKLASSVAAAVRAERDSRC